MREFAYTCMMLGLCAAGVGVFGWVLRDTMTNIQGIHDAALEEVVIHIGRPGPGACSLDVHLSVWDHMNSMGLYRWIVACEKAEGQP